MSYTPSEIVNIGPFTKAEALAKLVELRYYKVPARKTGKLTNRRERAIFLAVECFLPTEENKGFQGLGSVRIDHKQAVKFTEDVLRHLGERGAKIRMSVSDTCLFLG
jgi:hypothetical protein